MLRVVLGCFAVLVACDGGDDPPVDAGGDVSTDTLVPIAAPDIPWLDAGVPPLEIAPCPDGWREETRDGVTTCDPYPEGGAEECGVGEAHFPGEPGCRPIGSPCPAGDFAEGLSDATTVYVQPDATGGDGTRAAPYGALAEVPWPSLDVGTVVALAKGIHFGVLAIPQGVEVRGACVAETRLRGMTGPFLQVVTVTGRGEPARLRDLAIIDAPQFGVRVADGRSLTLEGVQIDRATGIGAAVTDTGSVLSVTDTVITRTQPDSVGALGDAVTVMEGGHFEATRFIAADNRDTGIWIRDGGASATLTDAVVRDTAPRTADRGFGNGIGVDLEGRLSATRILVSGNHLSGVSASLEGAEVMLTDAVIRDTLSQQSDLRFGVGLVAQYGGRVEATRVTLTGNREFGAFASEPGSVMTLTDVIVRDMAPRELDGDFGRGLSAQVGARLDATRVVVSTGLESGVFAGGEGAEVTLVDVLVRDTRTRELDDVGGEGVRAQLGASVDATRVRIVQSVEGGLVAFDGGDITARDIEISRVTGSEIPGRGFGHGAMAISASLSLERFAISDARLCGLFVAPLPTGGDAVLDVMAGVVERAEIGACVQIEGFDLSRLAEGVVYRDNGTNLSSTSLPVPEPRALVER